MKRICLILLLFWSQVAMGQLSDDSLKAICKELYKNRINDLSKVNMDGKYSMSVDELFKGYINDTKVFQVVASYFVQIKSGEYVAMTDAPVNYQLYFLNTKTGREIAINNDNEFNKFFENNVRLANLDKCYLYLIIVDGLTYNMTTPDKYPKAIREKSIFFKNAPSIFNTSGPLNTSYIFTLPQVNRKTDISYNQQFNEDVNSSTQSSIKLYAVSGDEIYRYQFSFNPKGQLERVKVKLLK